MASVQYGEIVTELKGRIGGQNFQSGLASGILRNIPTRRKTFSITPITPLGKSTRAIMAFVSASWRGLSSSQQAAWVAVTSSFPRYNKYGTVYTPSAFQLFCEFSLALVMAGEDIVIGAPSTSSFNNGAITFTYVSATPSITVAIAAPYPTAGYKVIISCSPYVSNGLAVQPQRLRIIGLKSFTAGTHSYDITSLITATYGSLVVGMQLWFGIKQINPSTGELGQLSVFNVLL